MDWFLYDKEDLLHERVKDLKELLTRNNNSVLTQQTFTSSKSAIRTIEKSVKYVQS